MDNKLLKRISHLSRWALFSLGAGQIFLVLFGSVPYLTANLCVGILLVVYLARVEQGNNFKTISNKILIVSLILFAMTIIYNYVVLLITADQLLVLNLLGIVTFFVTSHITALLVKVKYVTE